MSTPIFRDLGCREYLPVWEAMKAFTRERGPDTADEFWRVEHPPVFTQGQAGKPEHLLMPTEIPVIRTDRGGQITYHGPGQLVIYTLCDIRRCGLGVRGLVNAIENAVIALLADYGVVSQNRPDAPGVYVDGQKIAALGLRVSRGCSYHGLALNVDMDLSVYEAINPCGYAGLAVTQTRDLGISADIAQLADGLYQKLMTTIYRPSV